MPRTQEEGRAALKDEYDPRRLLLLMQYKGWGISDAADMGMTPLELSRTLRGTRRLEDGEADTVCRHAGFPDTFLLRRPSHRRPAVSEFMCAGSGRADLHSAREQAQIELLDMLMDDLETCYMNRAIEDSPLRAAFDHLRSTPTVDVEDKAREARKLTGWNRERSIVNHIEGCGVPVILLEGSRYLDSRDLAWASTGMTRPYIAINRTDHLLTDAHRGQLAHMLAHLILDEDHARCADAGRFARAFLLPEEQVRGMFERDGADHPYETIEGLRRLHGVSFETVVRRLHDLGLVDKGRERALMQGKGRWELERQMDMPQGRWITRPDGCLIPDPDDKNHRRSAQIAMHENRPMLFRLMLRGAFHGEDTGFRRSEAELVTGLPYRLLDAWACGMDDNDNRKENRI
jgi:Zn-dependent peptidase ImmA (M78 family)